MGCNEKNITLPELLSHFLLSNTIGFAGYSLLMVLISRYNRIMKRTYILITVLFILSACVSALPAGSQTGKGISKPEGTGSSPSYSITSPCNLPPISVPVMPEVIPGYTQLDEATGLHVTGKPLEVDLDTYRLKVSGLVDQPMQWDYEELRCLPKVTVKATLVCPGVFIDTTTWTGVPIGTLLEKAGVQKTATRIVMVSADGYQTYVPIKDAMDERSFLAYQWMDQPVPVLHGFPLRAVFPQLDGDVWAKWLVEIKVE